MHGHPRQAGKRIRQLAQGRVGAAGGDKPGGQLEVASGEVIKKIPLLPKIEGRVEWRLRQRGEFFIGYNQQMHYNRDAAIAKKREKEENTIAMSAVNTVATVDETTVA